MLNGDQGKYLKLFRNIGEVDFPVIYEEQVT